MTIATQITKALKANGYEQAKWRLHGVSVWNEGFLSSSSDSPSQSVLTWEFIENKMTAEMLATMTAKLAEIKTILIGLGYSVSVRQYPDDEKPYLVITKSNGGDN